MRIVKDLNTDHVHIMQDSGETIISIPLPEWSWMLASAITVTKKEDASDTETEATTV